MPPYENLTFISNFHLAQDTFVLTIYSFDLHVLSTPPAFVLSQDQTLLLNGDNCALAHFQIKFEKFRLFACSRLLATKRKSHSVGDFVASQSGFVLESLLFHCGDFQFVLRRTKFYALQNWKLICIYDNIYCQNIFQSTPLEKLFVNQLDWLKFELISHIHLCFPFGSITNIDF